MSDGEDRSQGPQFQAVPLITSAVMIGGGTMIISPALAVGGGHLLSTTRRWVNEMDVTPSELARMKWTQARAAMSAGAQAWQNRVFGPCSRTRPASEAIKIFFFFFFFFFKKKNFFF